MLRSDFSRKHKLISRIIIFCTQCVFQHIDVKSTSISRKIEVHIALNFQFCVSIDVFNHFNAKKT